ncbi:MAG: hypothetical protein OER21_14560 [Gemmatimonadota bacterium]|nr:hypothetical protein [Gemmatimonadota bacterium]
MLAGHYGVGFAAASIHRRTPLWAFLLAAQLPDIVFACLALAGIEQLRLARGTGAAVPLEPVFPRSHSLLGTGTMALLVPVTARVVPRLRPRAALLALIVVTHWMLDVLMYPPMLPLYDDAATAGLGLWAHPRIACLLETLVLVGGLVPALLLQTDRRLIMVLGGAIAVCHVAVYVLPDRMFVTPAQTLVLGLGLWLVFPAACWWADRRRPGLPVGAG